MPSREAAAEIVRRAIGRAVRAQVDPVLSFKIEHRLAEKDAAINEAVEALFASPSDGDGNGGKPNPGGANG
jgi:hypothetical protein